MFDIATHSEFDFGSSEFADLFARSDATPFQHPLWLDRLYARLAPGNEAAPVIVTVRTAGDGRLIGLLPLLRRRYFGLRVIEFADLGVSDYASPVCDRAFGQTLATDQTIGARIRDALKPYDLVWIWKIRDEALALTNMLVPGSCSRMDSSGHAVSLFAPFEQWRAATLNSGFARFLDRKRRQLGRHGRLRLDLLNDSDSITAAFSVMQKFRGLRFESQGKRDVLQQTANFEFYVDVALKGTHIGLSRTYLLRLDDRPVGALFGLVHRGAYLFLLMGFDFRDFRNYSVGLLLLEDAIADCIARGDTLFDLTIGDEPYKQSFGTKPTTLSTVWIGGTPIGSLAGALLGRVPRARALAKWILGQRSPGT